MKFILKILFISVLLSAGASGNSYPFNNPGSDTLSRHGFYIPADINECMRETDKSITDSSKIRIKALKESELNRVEELYIFNEWLPEGGSRTSRMFTRAGLNDTEEMKRILLRCYHRYLNGLPIEFENEVTETVKKLENLRTTEEKEYLLRQTLEYINGVYIPKDMKDCFSALDSSLDKDIIGQIRSARDSSMTAYHMNIGQWMRNRWGLWGGSRLQKYFSEYGVNHPDDMSGLILRSYYRYLNNPGYISGLKTEDIIKLCRGPKVILEEGPEYLVEFYTKEQKRFFKTRRQNVIVNPPDCGC
ncbi:MAG: DUF6794 domain-containing protein [Syntrophothermus sp.]